MSQRTAIFPEGPNTLYKKYGYSPAIRSGDLLFVSGMVGNRPDSTPEPDLEAQIALAFDNLREVLSAAGCTLDHVMDVTIFMTDPEASVDLAVKHYHLAFPAEPRPNITAIGVNWLAGFQFEIKVIARIPTGS